MKSELVHISKIRPNPTNPRTIKKAKFRKLVESIHSFPQMLELRPLVVDDDMIVLGGNMRLQACKEAGLMEVPIIKASELTEEQKQEFIIKDNLPYGEWDIDALANEWDLDNLVQWGMSAAELALAEIEEMVDESEYDDSPIYPIAPRVAERHDYVMIYTDNEIDYVWLRNFFNLAEQSDYKSTRVGQGRVISFNEFKKVIDERSGKVDNPESQKSRKG
jgi:hypothetical protein